MTNLVNRFASFHYEAEENAAAAASGYSTLSNYSSSINSLNVSYYIFLAVPMALFFTISVYAIKIIVTRIMDRRYQSNSVENSTTANNPTEVIVEAVEREVKIDDIESGRNEKENAQNKFPSLEVITATSTSSTPIPSPVSNSSFFSWLTSSPRTTVSSNASTPAASPYIENQIKQKNSLREWMKRQSIKKNAIPNNSSENNLKYKNKINKQYETNSSSHDDENYDIEFSPPSLEEIRNSLSVKTKKNKTKFFNYSDNNKNKEIESINNLKKTEISNDSYEEHMNSYLTNNINYSLRI